MASQGNRNIEGLKGLWENRGMIGQATRNPNTDRLWNGDSATGASSVQSEAGVQSPPFKDRSKPSDGSSGRRVGCGTGGGGRGRGAVRKGRSLPPQPPSSYASGDSSPRNNTPAYPVRNPPRHANSPSSPRSVPPLSPGRNPQISPRSMSSSSPISPGRIKQTSPRSVSSSKALSSPMNATPSSPRGVYPTTSRTPHTHGVPPTSPRHATTTTRSNGQQSTNNANKPMSPRSTTTISPRNNTPVSSRSNTPMSRSNTPVSPRTSTPISPRRNPSNSSLRNASPHPLRGSNPQKGRPSPSHNGLPQNRPSKNSRNSHRRSVALSPTRNPDVNDELNRMREMIETMSQQQKKDRGEIESLRAKLKDTSGNMEDTGQAKQKLKSINELVQRRRADSRALREKRSQLEMTQSRLMMKTNPPPRPPPSSSSPSVVRRPLHKRSLSDNGGMENIVEKQIAVLDEQISYCDETEKQLEQEADELELEMEALSAAMVSLDSSLDEKPLPPPKKDSKFGSGKHPLPPIKPILNGRSRSNPDITDMLKEAGYQPHRRVTVESGGEVRHSDLAGNLPVVFEADGLEEREITVRKKALPKLPLKKMKSSHGLSERDNRSSTRHSTSCQEDEAEISKYPERGRFAKDRKSLFSRGVETSALNRARKKLVDSYKQDQPPEEPMSSSVPNTPLPRMAPFDHRSANYSNTIEIHGLAESPNEAEWPLNPWDNSLAFGDDTISELDDDLGDVAVMEWGDDEVERHAWRGPLVQSVDPIFSPFTLAPRRTSEQSELSLAKSHDVIASPRMVPSRDLGGIRNSSPMNEIPISFSPTSNVDSLPTLPFSTRIHPSTSRGEVGIRPHLASVHRSPSSSPTNSPVPSPRTVPSVSHLSKHENSSSFVPGTAGKRGFSGGKVLGSGRLLESDNIEFMNSLQRESSRSLDVDFENLANISSSELARHLSEVVYEDDENDYPTQDGEVATKSKVLRSSDIILKSPDRIINDSSHSTSNIPEEYSAHEKSISDSSIEIDDRIIAAKSSPKLSSSPDNEVMHRSKSKKFRGVLDNIGRRTSHFKKSHSETSQSSFSPSEARQALSDAKEEQMRARSLSNPEPTICNYPDFNTPSIFWKRSETDGSLQLIGLSYSGLMNSLLETEHDTKWRTLIVLLHPIWVTTETLFLFITEKLKFLVECKIPSILPMDNRKLIMGAKLLVATMIQSNVFVIRGDINVAPVVEGLIEVLDRVDNDDLMEGWDLVPVKDDDIFISTESLVSMYREKLRLVDNLLDITCSQYPTCGRYIKPSKPFVQKKAKQFARDIEAGIQTKFKVLDFHPVELAKQLTLIDHRLFSVLPSSELIRGNFSKEETSPHLTAISKWFNTVTAWIGTLICSNSNIKDRRKLISHFIVVAVKLLRLGNFSGLMSVFAGLTQFTVARMKLTWKGLPLQLTEKWEYLEEVCSPIGNFKNLRELHDHAPLPCVKAAAIFVKDLTFMEDGYDTHLEIPLSECPEGLNKSKKKYYNIDKFKNIGKLLIKIQEAQRCFYEIRPVAVMQDFLQSIEVLDTESQRVLSKQNEP